MGWPVVACVPVEILILQLVSQSKYDLGARLRGPRQVGPGAEVEVGPPAEACSPVRVLTRLLDCPSQHDLSARLRGIPEQVGAKPPAKKL